MALASRLQMAPVSIRSISRVLSLSGLAPDPSSAALRMYGNRGETAPPSLPAHHREFVYVSSLPSSCQEAHRRGTADCSGPLATPSLVYSGRASLHTVLGCALSQRFTTREVSSSISALTHTHTLCCCITGFESV